MSLLFFEVSKADIFVWGGEAQVGTLTQNQMVLVEVET